VWRLPRALIALLVGLAALASGCGSSADIPDVVRAQLDVPANSLATLSDATSEEIPRFELLQAVARADALGVDLRIVIAGDDDDLVDAKAVADTYGGTVLSYKSGDVAFQAASENMKGDQLNRAVIAASTERDMGASALAFVRVLENEGLETEGTQWVRTVLLIAVVLGGLFFLYQLRVYLRARRRAERRRRQMVERRDVLLDWAQRLGADADALAADEGRMDPMTAAVLKGARETIRRVQSGVESADTLGELDAGEIRLARAAIKLRNVGQQSD
jgi:hypothetical protein